MLLKYINKGNHNSQFSILNFQFSTLIFNLLVSHFIINDISIMNFKQLLSAAALATLTLVPSQTNAQQLRAKRAPHLLKPQNSTLMLKAQKAPLGRELWGNVVKSTRWDNGTPEYGFYSFGASKSIDINELFTDDNMYANASGAMVGNRLDVIRYNREQNVMYHYLYNASTGECEDVSYLTDFSLWATETAVSADGKVYGVFFTGDADGNELGIADYASETRTTIGSVSRYYVALGITKDNVLYGIDPNGNLYSINSTTAKEKLIGSTGVKVSGANNDWNVQSGEIDQETGIFYWASTDPQGNSALYTVDLATAKATKIGDFMHNEQVAMLTIPKETVKDAAPALASDMSLVFDKASLTGKVSFTAPSTTYIGGSLSGSLSYVVSVDGKETKNGTASAGQKVEEALTVKRGIHSVAVCVSNAAGNGPKAYANRFIGDDIPLKPTNVKATVDVKTGKAQIAWNAVTKGVNEGYVGDLKYSVVRYPDSKTIAQSTSATSVSDVLPSGDLTGYYYTVQAISGQRKSESAKSNSVSFGNVLEPPYYQGFDNASALSTLTVIDENNDGTTWQFLENDGSNQSAVTISYAEVDHDDWLVLPALNLKAGVLYNLSYRVATMGSSFPEELEVKYGAEPTASAMIHEVASKTEYTNDQYVTVKKELTVDKDQVVYIGFHCTSNAAWCYQLVLDDIKLEGNSLKAPDATTKLSATPATDGSLKVRINFTAPDKAIDGTKLTSDLDVYILRDGAELQQMSAIKPGQDYYYMDNYAVQGLNTYSIIACNSEGTGRESKSVEAYVGEDTPSKVQNIKTSVGDNVITLTWDAVTTGEHGGHMSTEGMSYNVYEIYEGDTGADLELIDCVEEPKINIEYNVNEGDQDMINYALSAQNETGEGPRAMSPGIIVGKPYDLPFEEHFKGGRLDNTMWFIEEKGSEESTFSLMQGFSADGDGGCAGYVSASAKDAALLGSGKISLKGAANPTLVFSTKSTMADAKGKVVVYIRKPDLSEKQLCVVDYSKLDNSAKDWHTTSVTIPAEYTSLPYVMFTFVTSAAEGESVYFDQIYVRDVVAKDLRATLSVPSKVRKGDKVTARVMVTNMGSVAVDNYTVNLYAGDKMVDTKTVKESLASYASHTEVLTYSTSVVDASPLKLKAEVVVEGESTPEDNEDAAEVVLNASTLTGPDAVTATAADESTVVVEWTKVNETSDRVTDGFDAYAAWSKDSFGDWTSVYGEKGIAKGPFSKTYPHPNENQRFAYTVVEPSTWLPTELLDKYACLKPHSGIHYLASFYSVENSQFIPADNWLISPSLSGEAQTVSFWANNFNAQGTKYTENFEVLYSTSGITLDDFKSTGKKFEATTGEWKEYTVDLPAGATYFAIHNNTADTYMFMIDDIVYTAGCGKVLGYNVYRDGKLLKRIEPNAELRITDKAPSGKHTYAVSALYAGGESEATKSAVVTDINGVVNAIDGTFDVFTVDGKRIAKGVKSLDGIARGFYIVNGKKVVRK